MVSVTKVDPYIMLFAMKCRTTSTVDFNDIVKGFKNIAWNIHTVQLTLPSLAAFHIMG